MARKYPFTSILGWSASRHDTFRKCKRSYFYTYYAKHDKEFGEIKIKELKNLTSLPLEIGNITHDVIKGLLERLVKSSAPIHREKLNSYIRQLTHQYCTSKKFSEVYYAQISEIPMDEINEKASLYTNRMIDSERMQWLMNIPQEEKEHWIIEPEGFGETRINGLKAYCKVDFLIPHQEGTYIFDWKTGVADLEKHQRQMLGYALFAHVNLGMNPEMIKPILVYLKEDYNEVDVNITQQDILQFAESVKSETDEMYTLLKNVNENIPLEKESFPMREASRVCELCEFRELCKR